MCREPRLRNRRFWFVRNAMGRRTHLQNFLDCIRSRKSSHGQHSRGSRGGTHVAHRESFAENAAEGEVEFQLWERSKLRSVARLLLVVR